MDDPTATHGGDELDSACRAADRAFEVALEADPCRAFALATQMVESLGKHQQHFAQLRLQAVEKVREEGKTSLSVLANKLGITRPRAGQFVQAIEKARNEQVEDR